MTRHGNLLKEAKEKSHTLVQNAQAIKSDWHAVHDQPHKRGGARPDALNVKGSQLLLLAKQPMYNSFDCATVVSTILANDSNFKIIVPTNDVSVIQKFILNLVLSNPSGDTDIVCPLFVYDFIKYIEVSVNGQVVQKLDGLGMFMQQRGLQLDQKTYDDTYKQGVLCGGDLAFGTSREFHIPIDCVLTLNEVYGPGLNNDITFTIYTKASAWAGAVPLLDTAKMVLVQDEYSAEQDHTIAHRYSSWPLDFKFWETELHTVMLPSVVAGTTVRYQLAGVSGIVNSLAFVMKTSGSTTIENWITGYIQSFSILDSKGTRIHGEIAIDRDFHNRVILHDRQHVRLVDPDEFDNFLTIDFGDYASDVKMGTNTGFEVFDGKHQIEITYAAGTPSASYELDMISSHIRSMRVNPKEGRNGNKPVITKAA